MSTKVLSLKRLQTNEWCNSSVSTRISDKAALIQTLSALRRTPLTDDRPGEYLTDKLSCGAAAQSGTVEVASASRGRQLPSCQRPAQERLRRSALLPMNCGASERADYRVNRLR